MDVFCTVIDNYGDIGTSWRLAYLLKHQHQQTVRLWVDDLAALHHLVPEAHPLAAHQYVHEIEVCHWGHDFAHVTPAQVVIEAFGCTIPDAYRHKMRSVHSVWLHLDYLSAEAWVSGCHGLPSLQSDGLQKWMFFPGITDHTGGLLCEADLQEQRALFDEQAAQDWCVRWQIPIPRPHSYAISLFSYENTAIAQLIPQLIAMPTRVDLYIPLGKICASLEAYLSTSLMAGQSLSLEQLNIHIVPFLPQSEYDRLLWLCDLNFVRGEESLTRAIWAEKPFIWHIYPTEDQAHWDKLNAFIDATNMHPVLRDMTLAWNAQQLAPFSIQTLIQHHDAWLRQAQIWGKKIRQQGEMSINLMKFIESKL